VSALVGVPVSDAPLGQNTTLLSCKALPIARRSLACRCPLSRERGDGALREF
jgi:hypothetical protein